jgi:hypothetical protein
VVGRAEAGDLHYYRKTKNRAKTADKKGRSSNAVKIPMLEYKAMERN